MKLILHIGFPKTGTTAIQYALKESSERLKENGVIYPLIAKDFKQRWLKEFVSKGNNEEKVANVNKKYYNDLRSVSEKDAYIAIMSCEELTNSFMTDYSISSLKNLYSFLSSVFDEIELISYLRPPESFYLSMMQEKVKRSPGIIHPSEYRTNYFYILSSYENAFNSKVKVRVFEKEKLDEGDIVKDFFNAVGLRELVDKCGVAAPSTNESVSAELMYILSATREYDSFSYWNNKGREDHEQYWRKLKKLSQSIEGQTKPKLMPGVATAVYKENRQDLENLSLFFDVTFKNSESIHIEPLRKLGDDSVSVADICEVDMNKVMSLIGVMSDRV